MIFFTTSLRGGGAEKVMITLARAFAEDGYNISLVVLEFDGEYSTFLPDSINIEILRGPKLFPKIIGKFLAFVRLLGRSQAKLIFTTLPGGSIFCFFAWLLFGRGPKLVLREASTPSLILKRYGLFKSFLVPIILRFAYRSASAVIAPSAGSALDLSEFYGISLDSISIIANPVELEGLEFLETHSHPYFLEGGPVVVGIGRLDKQKRFSDLISAISLLHGRGILVKLIIFGDGPEKKSLLNQISAQHLTEYVDLPGFELNVLSALKSCDVFTLVSEVEGLPNTLLQALACRRQVVSTDCKSGPREILAGGEFGALVPVGDIDAIARAISEALFQKKEIDFDNALLPFRLNRIKAGYRKVFGV